MWWVNVNSQRGVQFIILLILTFTAGACRHFALTAEPNDEYNFGPTYVGMPVQSRPYNWKNITNENVEVQGILPAPLDSPFTSRPSFGQAVTLTKDTSTRAYNFEFAPTDAGEFSAGFTPQMANDDLAAQEVRVSGAAFYQLSSEAFQISGDEITPNRPLDFGNVVLPNDPPVEKTIILTNHLDFPWRLYVRWGSTYYFQSADSNEHFDAPNIDAQHGFEIPGNSSYPVKIIFSPRSAGQYTEGISFWGENIWGIPTLWAGIVLNGTATTIGGPEGGEGEHHDGN